MEKTEEQRLKYNAYMREYLRKKKGTVDYLNPGRPANTPEVLWSKVDIREPDECWPWKGMATKSGYGRTWINDVAYYAHRVIYNLAKPGEIELRAPANKKAHGFLMHTCDNRICCNPAHLRVADIKTNNEDCVRKGRRVLPKGEDHHRSVFTNDEIRQVLEMWKLGLTARQIGMNLNKKRATIQSLLRRIRLREGN
jgi:hypothetical protein